MLTILFLILIIFIPSLYISIKKCLNIEKVIPCTIFFIILTIYIFGLLNLLKFGVFILYISFIIIFLLFLIEIIKKKLDFFSTFKIIFKPSILIWLLGIFFIYFYYKEKLIVSWDEFTHWGDVVKMMYYNNIYNTNAASLSSARAYPPTMSIFQYFVQNLGLYGFKEQYLYCAYHVFTISLILPFIKDVKWKEIFKIILILFIVILAPTIFFSTVYYYYNIIYIDPFLGILFGYVMAYIFINKNYNKFEVASISLALFALTLTKDIAPLFSFIALIFAFLSIVIADKKYIILKKINKNNIKKFIKEIKPILIFFIVIMVAYLSWKINVILNTKDLPIENSNSIMDIINLLLNSSGTYRSNVVVNYINTLSSYKLTSMGNIYLFNSIILLFGILLYNSEKKSNKLRFVFGFSTLYLGEILYILIMLILYLVMFSEYEALHLASFERYMGIYLTAILYFVIFITIYRGVENNKYKNILILLIIIILNANLSSVFINTLKFKSDNRNTQVFRESYKKSVDDIRKKIGIRKKYKFYIISQDSNGMDKWILRYEMRDILKGMNEGFNWSLGEKYNEEDIWTLNITKEEFKNKLLYDNYDYVFLYKIDKKFIKRYGSLFDNTKMKSRQLYKVNRRKKVLEFVN